MEILKQPQYEPLSVEKQVLIIYAGTNGHLDRFDVSEALAYQTELFRFIEARRAGILVALREKKVMSDELKAEIESALKEFGQQFAAARKAA
jgi:F-type H+-transporting ATPase subunit alpha